DTVIHWYQHKENKAPVRVLYISSGKTTVDDNFQRHRYTVQNHSGQKLCALALKDVVPDDTATYHCAYRDPRNGRNPAITSTNTPLAAQPQNHLKDHSSLPPNSEILQKKHENQLLYVCLIEKFYPDVIRVKWTDEADKEVTQNVVKGDVWKSTKEDMYSVSTWLTVPLESKDKEYFCKYEHESQQGSVTTKGIYYIFLFSFYLLWVCFFFFNRITEIILFCLMFVTDHLMHRAAHLVYVVLLLKSSMYYVIVLFFVYK
ncbi:TCC3 protein, partial [Chauna torquata]|nr:TCC3 protein [Chauna torquata]